MNKLSTIALLATLPVHAEPYLISSDTPFSKNASVEIKETVLPGLTKPTDISKIEKGELSGVAYRFLYDDGSGTFAGTQGNTLDPSEHKDSNWSVQCSKDAMTDMKSCLMEMNFLGIYVTSISAPVVLIGSNGNIKEDAMIRIDTARPISTSANVGARYRSFTEPANDLIINSLKKAQVVVTRHSEFGNGMVDRKWTLYGFNEAFAYIKWAVAHIK